MIQTRPTCFHLNFSLRHEDEKKKIRFRFTKPFWHCKCDENLSKHQSEPFMSSDKKIIRQHSIVAGSIETIVKRSDIYN